MIHWQSLTHSLAATILRAAGVILVSLGTRYQSYCANISRTYIINPSKVQESQYNALLAAQEAAIAALKEGAPAKASMEAAVKVSMSLRQSQLHGQLAASYTSALKGQSAPCYGQSTCVSQPHYSAELYCGIGSYLLLYTTC